MVSVIPGPKKKAVKRGVVWVTKYETRCGVGQSRVWKIDERWTGAVEGP